MIDSGGNAPANTVGFCKHSSHLSDMDSTVGLLYPPADANPATKRYGIVNTRQLTAVEGNINGRILANINAYLMGSNPSPAKIGGAFKVRPNMHLPEHPRHFLKRKAHQL